MRGEKDWGKGFRTGMISAVEGIYLWVKGRKRDERIGVLMWFTKILRMRKWRWGGPEWKFSFGELFCLLFSFSLLEVCMR